MTRYALTLLNMDANGWRIMREKGKCDLLQVGQSIKLKDEFKSTLFYQILGDKTYIIDEVRLIKNWKWLPFEQLIGIKGDNENLFFNRLFI